MIEPWTEEERGRLLERRLVSLQEYNRYMDEGNARPPWSVEENSCMAKAHQYLLEAEAASKAYYERLPRMALSCCPIDGKPLLRCFDPFGLDGLWWCSDATPTEPAACAHFCCLTGAVNFNGMQPHAGSCTVHIGPEVPYVIPRLLEYEGVIAVITEVKMGNGYTAYPVAYFAKRRLQPEFSTAGWARSVFVYTTQLGISAWRLANEKWDFDLGPWLESGRIRWCDPNSGNTQLSEDPPDRCPYLNMTGKRERIVVRAGVSWSTGLPSEEAAFL